jgi:hypothetical protein
VRVNKFGGHAQNSLGQMVILRTEWKIVVQGRSLVDKRPKHVVTLPTLELFAHGENEAHLDRMNTHAYRTSLLLFL